MVDKADITGSIPTSSTINIVADGEIIDASIENTNNQQLLQISTLLYQFVRDDCPSLSVTNTFTAEQIFNILKATQIQPAVTNGDLTLNPNGTGKVRYADGSGNTEVASKGYVNLTTGNIPPGGVAKTWLEGNGGWSDPRWYADESSPSSGFTAEARGNYVLNAGDSIQLPSPVAGLRFMFQPQIGQDLTATPITVLQNSSEKIANGAETFTANQNRMFFFRSNGTDWDVASIEIGRAS